MKTEKERIKILSDIRKGKMLDNYDEEVLSDKELMMEAVKVNGLNIQNVSESLVLDKDIVLESVKENGTAIKFVPEFKDDIEIATEAVKSNGWSLEFLSNRLKNDETIVQYAIESSCNINVLKFASKELQDKFSKKV
jgi:hypothetical protein